MGKDAIRGYAASSAPRCSFSQSKMRAVFVMVGDVLGKQPLQVPVVHQNLPRTEKQKRLLTLAPESWTFRRALEPLGKSS